MLLLLIACAFLLPLHFTYTHDLTDADGSCGNYRVVSKRRLLVGDADPEMAPLLLAYGKALYDLASSQASVMGREEPVRQEDGKPISFIAKETHWGERPPGLAIRKMGAHKELIYAKT